ncbi:MAG: hypothetical protein LBE84_10465 [Planctomycetota bacterium]|jgi:hypothetical protein|nr:hypothetical protein [Planctomycetota bacterium]
MTEEDVGALRIEARQAARSARIEADRDFSKRRRFRMILLFLSAVLAGAVLGAAGSAVYFRRFRRPPTTEMMVQAMMARLESAVEVTQAERVAAERISRRRMDRVGDMWSDVFAATREEFEAMHAEMGELLGPGRFQVWDRLERERWRRMREKMGRHEDHRRRGEGRGAGPAERKSAGR